LNLTNFLKRLFLHAQLGEIALVFYLVELVHGSETSPEKEKIELLRFLFLLGMIMGGLPRNFSVGSFLTDGLATRNYHTGMGCILD